MGVIEFIRSREGIAHRRILYAAGFSRQQLRAAEHADAIRRVRRDWFMVRGCSEPMYRAVRAGGSLGCVSAAVERGLWVADAEELHIAASAHSGHVDRTPQLFNDGREVPIVVHWREAAVGVPRVALEPLAPMLLSIADCQKLEYAVASIDSALNRGLIRIGEFQLLAATSRSSKVRAVAKLVDGRADSGIESIPRVRLRLLGIEMVPQVRIDGHPVDGLIGERLVLQMDGYGPHSSRSQRNRDLLQDARLVQDGYTVFRFSYDAVMFDWPRIESLILSALAQGRHRTAA